MIQIIPYYLLISTVSLLFILKIATSEIIRTGKSSRLNSILTPIKYHVHKTSKRTLKEARRIIVFVVGVTIIFIGILLLVLPGPGLVTMMFGLTVLATEFVWAQIWLAKFRYRFEQVTNKIIRKEEIQQK